MKKIFLQNKEKILLLFIFLFSFFINYFYANKGVSPHDSFSHFDTGFRILLGEYPFKDYWIISGPIIDYIQGFFFYIFGTNWNAYVLHASFLNCSITIATFFVLKNFDIGILQSFLFSIFFFNISLYHKRHTICRSPCNIFFITWYLLFNVGYKK